jgi:hypothetical protein
MIDFHKTGLGQMFYGKHVPEIIKELRRIADGLEQGNKMMMRESKLTKKAAKVDEKIKNVKELDKLENNTAVHNEGVHKPKSDPDLAKIDE